MTSLSPMQGMAAVSPADPEFASWGSRVVSTIIDGIIIGVVSVPLGILAFRPRLVNNGVGTQKNSLAFTTHPEFIALLLVVQVLWAIYVMFAVSSPRGATVGMRVAKIRIVDMNYNTVTKGRALSRFPRPPGAVIRARPLHSFHRGDLRLARYPVAPVEQEESSHPRPDREDLRGEGLTLRLCAVAFAGAPSMG
jgi:hypothetical protein